MVDYRRGESHVLSQSSRVIDYLRRQQDPTVPFTGKDVRNALGCDAFTEGGVSGCLNSLRIQGMIQLLKTNPSRPYLYRLVDPRADVNYNFKPGAGGAPGRRVMRDRADPLTPIPEDEDVTDRLDRRELAPATLSPNQVGRVLLTKFLNDNARRFIDWSEAGYYPSGQEPGFLLGRGAGVTECLIKNVTFANAVGGNSAARRLKHGLLDDGCLLRRANKFVLNRYFPGEGDVDFVVLTGSILSEMLALRVEGPLETPSATTHPGASPFSAGAMRDAFFGKHPGVLARNVDVDFVPSIDPPPVGVSVPDRPPRGDNLNEMDQLRSLTIQSVENTADSLEAMGIRVEGFLSSFSERLSAVEARMNQSAAEPPKTVDQAPAPGEAAAASSFQMDVVQSALTALVTRELERYPTETLVRELRRRFRTGSVTWVQGSASLTASAVDGTHVDVTIY